MSEYDIRSALETLTNLSSHASRYGLDDDEVAVMNATASTLNSLVTPHPDPPVIETIDLVEGPDGIWAAA